VRSRSIRAWNALTGLGMLQTVRSDTCRCQEPQPRLAGAWGDVGSAHEGPHHPAVFDVPMGTVDHFAVSGSGAGMQGRARLLSDHRAPGARPWLEYHGSITGTTAAWAGNTDSCAGRGVPRDGPLTRTSRG
jgi:hypothetical protein